MSKNIGNVIDHDRNPYELKIGSFISFPDIEQPSDRLRLTRPSGDLVAYEIVEGLSAPKSFGSSYRAVKYIGEKKTKQQVFLKTPRISSNLPISEIQRHLGTIFQSFTTEYLHKELIDRLNKPKKVAGQTFGIGFYKIRNAGNEVIIPFLVQEYIQHPALNKFLALTEKSKLGITEPEQWFSLSEKIIRIVRSVHNNQMIHGEIEPKNLLIHKRSDNTLEPILVDFGKSFLLDVSLARSVTDRAGSVYVAPECRNERDAYSATADIYALGGVLLFLSTGDGPPDIETWAKQTFGKDKHWHEFTDEDVELWKNAIHDRFKRNTGLMQKHEGIVKVIDKCLRPLPQDRYASAHKLLQALNSVKYSDDERKDPEAVCKDLTDEIKKQELHPLFSNIIADRVELIRKDLADMQRGHFEIYGEREDLIDTLVKYISVLQPGDTYITVTVPDYWTKDNLGINGRFLTVNKDLVRSGVHIRRLFLVSKGDLLEGSDSNKILQAHYQAYKDLGDHGRESATFDADITPGNIGTIFVGVCEFTTKQELRDYQRVTSHVAIWQRKQSKESMSIVFFSRPKFDRSGQQVGSQIVQVRFRNEDNTREYELMKSMFSGLRGVRSLSELYALDGTAMKKPAFA